MIEAMSEDLPAVAGKIARVLAIRPECFITHPAELHVLKTMSWDDLRDFAAQRGWCIVRRVGGRQIEFYNDASRRTDL
jgi:hypothetical protein